MIFVKKKVLLFLFLFCAILISPVYAADPSQIIVNSEDWREVYSVTLYGTLAGKTSNFLVSNRHATLILGSIPRGAHVWAITSKNFPYIAGYRSILQSRGYTAEEFIYDNVNLEFAKLLDTKDFIVIDDSYGYNAISIAPYAIVTKSYVLFADRNNINDVDRFLSEVGPNSVLIYGHVDREVKEALTKYDPETINEEGDRFLNNIEIVKKYKEVKNSKQVILTNGEFIEKEIMSGAEPVIFIGTNNVPDVVREYIQGSDIDVGVLIGNELVGTATYIRRQVGISVFVKFAQGARAPKGAISQVEALDMFYLPVYSLKIQLESIKYNQATDKLEVTLRNMEDQAAYFTGTYTLSASDGSRQTVGDVEASFIDGNEIKTMVYDVETMPDGPVTVDLFVIYGESRGSLEKEIRGTLDVEVVRVLDECELDTENIKVLFNKRNKYFYVEVKNMGSVKCYVDLELVDVLVAGEKQTYGLEKVATLEVGKQKQLRIKSELEDEDLEDNPKVKVKGYYGQREDALVKVFEREVELELKAVDYMFYGLLTVIIILILLIIWKRYKDKDKENK